MRQQQVVRQRGRGCHLFLQRKVKEIHKDEETVENSYPGFSSGRPRGTTPADDRYIVLQARRNRRQTAGEIARHTTHRRLDDRYRIFTVARRLHGGGLFARRPLRYESRFSLSSDSHRILIWRSEKEAVIPSNIIESDRYGGRGVLVWGGIMLGSRSDLHIFVQVQSTGPVIVTRFFFHMFVLLEAPWRLRIFNVWIGWHDLRISIPSSIYGIFDGQRQLVPYPPVTIREIRLALQDEWAAMPQQLIDSLILSMGRRCETCLAVR
ncbi:transposable element Tcb1 transposase [Trichonephila clavipes]|nr:transposable element Tcb1 transposase [Trichonephila clavipes]